MDREITDLYDEYSQGMINRRIFLKKLAQLTGGAAVAWSLLPILENTQANAAKIAEDDIRLNTQMIQYSGVSGEVKAYSARRKGDEKLSGVVVVHENKGLNPHIEDITRRIAAEGFAAIAPDALSPKGGTPLDMEEAKKLIRGLDMDQTIGDFVAAVKYLDTHPNGTGKVGIVGFCWGGAMANQVAVRYANLDAAVPFYGRQPDKNDVPKIKAALLLHYAGDDNRINKGIADYEAALKNAGVDYRIFMYDGAKHAFNNDTNPERYHPKAAELAWKRTLGFFKENLYPNGS